MAGKKTGLGRGLGALIPEDFSLNAPAPASTLPISMVESYAGQPRKHFDQEKLEELADSIREHGVIQPLTVRKLSSGYYQIIAGERRWRAARLAGLTEIPAVVIEADDRTAMELAMIENLQREDLNPMEAAQGFQALMDQYNLTQEQAASTVAASNLSVRQTEQLVKRLMTQPKEKPKKDPAAVDYVAEAERDLSTRLGRACRIAHGKKKGRIEIEYYGVDDLNDLLEALGKLGK